MMHINTLDKVREDWQSEHIKACEVPEPVAAQEGIGLPPRIWGVYFARNAPPPLLQGPNSHRIA